MSGQRAMGKGSRGSAALDGRVERYRQAERDLWEQYGLTPTERFVELESPAVRLRIVDVGTGEPVLFVPGSGGVGPYWAPLVREMAGFRCLLMDRPGWGLSSPVDYSKGAYGAVAADVLGGVLDAFGLNRVHVVGASIGAVWALRLAARRSTRVNRVILLGGAPIVSDVRPPVFIRLLASPLGAIIVRVPQKPQRVRSILRQLGHGPSIDAGRIPPEYFAWRTSFERETRSTHNEREMVRALVRGGGFRPGLTFDDSELATIEQPTLMVVGTSDPVGSVDIWRRVAATLPRGELLLVDGGGHMPWLDDPGHVGSRICSFLTANRELAT
jgi:2-hydroxy-6-oxonona-2,4-dienedioate hydrolase